MTPKTQHAYRSLARHFKREQLASDDCPPDAVAQALVRAAPEYRPNYFRRLRSALALDQLERNGEAAAAWIQAARNPVTAPGSTLAKKAKKPRQKSISQPDFVALMDRLQSRGHLDEFFALSVIYFTGARPCELRQMVASDGLVFIKGAKQSPDHQRGADRTLRIDDPQAFSIIEVALGELRASGRSIGAIRDRLRLEASALWPRRRLLPTLYTLRHQMGADLKASGVDPRVAAYIMGHQSTNSLSVYGNRRQGDPRRIVVEPADLEAVKAVRGKLSDALRMRMYQSLMPAPSKEK